MRTEPQQTYERPYRPLGIGLYNSVGRLLDRCGVRLSDLTEESILGKARRRAKLTDFGGEAFRVPLRELLGSYRNDARLNPFGRFLLRRQLVDLAVNRLQIQADLKRYPEILDVPIRKPLFVTGLPRTGTTFLYNLLSRDPQGRPLLTWEAFWPSPPPETATRQTDPRIKKSRAMVKMIHRLVPQLPAVHELTHDGPTECLSLSMNTFVTPVFSMMADIPGYEQWLRELDLDGKIAAFEDYRRQLQLLAWRCPGDHWVLKQPAHLAGLDALLTVFPDACIAQTHRDPAKAIPSLCSLFGMMRGMASDEVDTHALGAHAAELCAELVDRGSAARETAPDRFFDIHYADLVADPIGTVHRIYDSFGYERNDGMDAAMRRLLADDAHTTKPPHRYDLAQFGLDRACIDRLFDQYCERFAIPRES